MLPGCSVTTLADSPEARLKAGELLMSVVHSARIVAR